MPGMGDSSLFVMCLCEFFFFRQRCVYVGCRVDGFAFGVFVCLVSFGLWGMLELSLSIYFSCMY